MEIAESGADLKILVVDENPIRRAIIDEGLREAGYANVVTLATTLRLVDHIYRLDPDVILMDLENPSRDVLDQMFQVSRAVRRPIAMFVDQSERGSIAASVDAGVSAYIVDGLKKERVSAILEMTVSRFRVFDKLRAELDEAKTALKDRKTIDRAKGFLMKTKGLNEDAAYKLLRQTAMRQSRKIADVAESLLSAIDLLDAPGDDAP
ncbi:MAG: ANTAR domain-containing response regulator [Hyphomicrobium sp.]